VWFPSAKLSPLAQTSSYATGLNPMRYQLHTVAKELDKIQVYMSASFADLLRESI